MCTAAEPTELWDGTHAGCAVCIQSTWPCHYAPTTLAVGRQALTAPMSEVIGVAHDCCCSCSKTWLLQWVTSDHAVWGVGTVVLNPGAGFAADAAVNPVPIQLRQLATAASKTEPITPGSKPAAAHSEYVCIHSQHTAADLPIYSIYSITQLAMLRAAPNERITVTTVHSH